MDFGDWETKGLVMCNYKYLLFIVNIMIGNDGSVSQTGQRLSPSGCEIPPLVCY